MKNDNLASVMQLPRKEAALCEQSAVGAPSCRSHPRRYPCAISDSGTACGSHNRRSSLRQ
jgi:hypothetical protein